MGGTPLEHNWYSYKKRERHTDKSKRPYKDTVRGKQLQAKDRCPRKTKPANTLTLDFQPLK